jgi:LPS-assembly lipoprotein
MKPVMKPVLKSARTITVFASIAMLSACGFKPMHAPAAFTGGQSIYGDVSVVTPNNNKEDFLLKQALRGRMGDASSTSYALTITPVLTRRTLGIGNDDVGSRYDLVMETAYSLTKGSELEPVMSGDTRSVSTFAAPRDPYSTIAAQDNATEKLANDSADRILARLAQYFDSVSDQ